MLIHGLSSNTMYMLLSSMTLSSLAAARPNFEFPGQYSGNPLTGMLRQTCPTSCAAGPTGFSWTQLRSIQELSNCNETQLFEISVALPLDEADGPPGIRACVATDTTSNKVQARIGAQASQPFGPACASHARLMATNVAVELGVLNSTEAAANPTDLSGAIEELRQNLLVNPNCDDTILFSKVGSTVAGLYVGFEVRKSTAAPVLARIMDSLQTLQTLSSHPGEARPALIAAQVCASNGTISMTKTLGVVVGTMDNIAAVHGAIAAVSAGQCLAYVEKSTKLGGTLGLLPGTALTSGISTYNNRTVPTNGIGGGSNSTLVGRSLERPHVALGRTPRDVANDCSVYKVQPSDSCWKIATQMCSPSVSVDDLVRFNGGSSGFCDGIQPGQYLCCSAGSMPNMDPKAKADGTCAYVEVALNDTCATIAASRCGGISVDQLRRFNGGGGGNGLDCSSLQEHQPLCCTQGTLPDLRPKINADGSCAVHVVDLKQLCYQIEAKYYLKPGDMERFNTNKTWAFAGCATLQPNMRVCVSDGTPPMPASIKGHVCGPQVPGTQPVARGNTTKLQDLNPCVLNSCCDGWGQCGTTDVFCTDTSINGVPGTKKTGTNGCISNCGTDIVNNKEKPASFAQVAYYEGWNSIRPCLHMSVQDIATHADAQQLNYTHIHFAFGSISPSDYSISIPAEAADQFRVFVGLRGLARSVLSFGGWAFSTEAATIEVFRQGVTDAHREMFARNVVAFVVANNLGGVDFDWEYPGAYDIPGTTPGTPEQGGQYLQFLKLVRQYLPKDKTLSIAAPASFWYLRWFPIREISEVVDYIVYMTYDLHGQWDVNNAYSSPGCGGGNCLRSHINYTETVNALSMITKAGVSSTKIVVGVSSYGRSFKMSRAGCTGSSCTYEGGRDASPAAPGACTNTSGYLAEAEIRGVMAEGDDDFDGTTYTAFHDDASDSDILVYDDTEWVSWMDMPTKKRRVDRYRSLNFGGVSDWAVDLQKEYDPTDNSNGLGSGTLAGNFSLLDMQLAPCDYGKTYASLDDLEKDADGLEPTCTTYYTLHILQHMLSDALAGFQDAKNSYDDKFDTYSQYIKDTINSQLLALMATDGPLLPFFKCYRADGSRPASARSEAKEWPSCNHREPDGYKDYTWWFEVTNATGLNATLADNGIVPDWVVFGDRTIDLSASCPTDSDHLGSGCPGFGQLYHDFPIRGPSVEVPNPADIINKAAPGIDALSDELDDKLFDLVLGTWDADNVDDIAQVLALPIFLITDAVASMKQVKAIGAKVQEDKKKDLILEILSGVLFLVPFVGEAAGTLGRIGADIARLLMALDQVGNAALSIYSIVDDPSMAPIAIFGMLMGAGFSVKGPKEYHDMGIKKAEMEAKGANAGGATMREINPKLDRIFQKTCGK